MQGQVLQFPRRPSHIINAHKPNAMRILFWLTVLAVILTVPTLGMAAVMS